MMFMMRLLLRPGMTMTGGGADESKRCPESNRRAVS